MAEKELTIAEIREKLKGKTIIWTPYMHADWAWCHTRQWHEIRYVSVFEDVIALLEKNIGFKWYMDCYRTEFQSLLDRKPELLPKLRQYVASGDIEICGTYSNVRPNMVADEAYVRNMILGRRLFSGHFPGAQITVHADAVDVALGHQQIPQLIAKGGFRYYRAGRPYKALADADGLTHELVWQGLDGTRVPVWWAEYGGLFIEDSVRKVSAAPGKWEETVRHLYREELSKAFDDSELDVVLCSIGCDDVLPLKAFNRDVDLEMPEAIEKWNATETSKMRFGTPIDFFREMEKRLDKVRVVEGAIDICDVSYNIAWGAERGLIALRLAGAETLALAERMMALAQMAGAGAAHDLTGLWQDNLTASAHATAWLFDKDFDEIHKMAAGALAGAEKYAREAAMSLTRKMRLPDGAVAVLFNPGDGETKCAAEFTLPAGRVDGLALIDGFGDPVEWQVLKPYEYTDGVWEHEIVAKVRLPASGYNTVYTAPAAVDCRYSSPYAPAAKPKKTKSAAPFELDNGILKLSFKNGDLTEIYDRGSGGAVYPGRKTPWNALRFTKIDTDASGLHDGPVEYRQNVHFSHYEITETGPVRWRARLFGQDVRCGYIQTVTITKGSREIAFETRMDWPDGQQGFLSCAVPAEGNDLLYGGLPFGIEQKDVAAVKYGNPTGAGSPWLNAHRGFEGLFTAKDFAAAQGSAHTAALYSIRGDRYYLYDKNTKELGYILLNTFTAFDNSWEREMNRFSFGQAGGHVLAWAVGVYPRETEDHAIARIGRALRLPVVACPPYRALDGDCTLPPAGPLLRCDKGNIALSALHAQNGGYILRVWESAGRKTDAAINLPAPVKTAQKQDFIGNAAAGEVSVGGGAVCISLGPWEIATLYIETESGGKP